jgi:uridine monophosphate synthetase
VLAQLTDATSLESRQPSSEVASRNPLAMVATVSPDLRALILELHDIGAVKVGSFTLKSGIRSPFYIDLRVTVSHPAVLSRVASALAQAVADTPHDVLCGVPYTALPFATVMSMNTGRPMVMRRKEAKAYGTKKLIEGTWKDGDVCLIVEDLVTSGMSVLETVAPVRASGMTVSDVVVLLDREQGGRENLAAKNIALHAVLSMSSMVDVLESENCVDPEMAKNIRQFIANNQVQTVPASGSGEALQVSVGAALPSTHATYEQRAEQSESKMAKRIFALMAEKQTNLAVAADVTDEKQLLSLADAIGPEICVLKTHADIVEGWTESTGRKLRELADQHKFLVFEDRKFADIGNTVAHQCNGGVHKISQWADIINAHSVPGPGIISGLSRACSESGREVGLLLLAQMSSEGNLASSLPGYTEKTVDMARGATDFVCGFISQNKIAGNEFVYMTPGVQLEKGGDALGQQYNTPESVICERNSDIIIVGRGIYSADDSSRAAQSYRKAGWQAYLKRCGRE